MKRWIALFLCPIILCCFTACSADFQPKSDRLHVVATVFPAYDWLKEIVGDVDAADLTLLLDNGVDMHSYQPTVDDIVTLSTCDLFLYVGGESDDWVADALAEAANPDMVVINLLSALGDAAKEEELVEGMQAEEEDEVEYDEHVWLSLKNAAFFCRRIADALGKLDASHADAYTANANDYIEKLNALDAEYEKTVTDSPLQTLVFADRFPFRYLTDDYGLTYYAAFAGCSAETEAGFQTIVFLADQIDRLGVHTILQTESADGSIARTVKEATKTRDQTVLTVDSMQSTTLRDAQNGATYLSIMESNLAVLRQALA